VTLCRRRSKQAYTTVPRTVASLELSQPRLCAAAAQAVFKDVMSSLPRMEEIRLDLATGAATKRVAADIPCEFPVVPAHLVGALGPPASWAWLFDG